MYLHGKNAMCPKSVSFEPKILKLFLFKLKSSI